MKLIRRTLLPALALMLVANLAAAQDIASFEKKIAVKKLANGLTVIIMERPEAPVFSYFTYVDSGNVQDPMGASGIAHMFEHMAFKGTDKIGTSNHMAERVALAAVEKAYAAYDLERRREIGFEQKKVDELKAAFEDAVKKADSYVVPNEFDEIVSVAGGVGMNASTSYDETLYFYSMPANRLELWAYLESERYLKPVMREFYKERDVVLEERKFRTDSSPVGRLFEQFISMAFLAHPYRRRNVLSELTSFSATDAAEFYKKHYTPANMVVALVGDVKIATAMPVVEKYFGRLPAGPKPEPLRTTEPKQFAEKTVIIREQSQPIYWEGYHKPSFRHPDEPVHQVIGDILSSGRTSRLYRSLVRDQKLAVASGGGPGFPGEKYPNLFFLQVIPLRGKTPEVMGEALHKELDRLKNEDVTDEELQAAKTRARANLIRGLGNNTGLAAQLAEAQTRWGDWRELFRNVDRIQKVTKEDIKRVAKATFVPSNRTVGMIVSEQQAAPPAAAPAAKGND